MKSMITLVVSLLALATVGACAIGSGVAQSPLAPTPTAMPIAPTPVPPPDAAGESTTTRITVRESEMNQSIAQGLSGEEISNVQIDIHPGALANVTATIRSGGLNLRPTASVQLSTRDGRIVMDVLRIDVGGFGVPSNLIEPQIAQLEQAAETELNKQFAEMRATTGMTLRALSTTEESLTLEFGP